MAWKNLQQTTLVDAMLIEHEALKEFDDVHEVAQPIKFMFITTCGHNNDSDILGYKSGWGSLEVMRLQKESIEDLKERTQKIFFESDAQNRSIFILRCIYENKPMARP